jgi:hypothetical protein
MITTFAPKKEAIYYFSCGKKVSLIGQENSFGGLL